VHYIAAFGILTLIYVAGMFNEILGIDATQYASMSLQMSKSGNWLQLTDQEHDYLDKPPLHFWLSALAFKLFGVSDFVYRLPSFLIGLLGVYSTYRLGKELYNKPTGQLAALMFYACIATLLMNQDVRTDTILVGLLAYTLWQIAAFVNRRQFINLMAGAIGIGLAMLAKGPIGLMVPVLAIGTHVLVKKDWKLVWRWEWPVALIIAGLVISPFLYGLYQQWDLHPEKDLHGIKNISGIRFFLWDQSFGRLTGTNPFIIALKPNQTYDATFFVHTSAWAFMPWFPIAITALALVVWPWLRHPWRRHSGEALLAGAIVFPFIAVSLSEYMLPHYIYITYPFLAILAANRVLVRWQRGQLKAGWSIAHLALGLLMAVTALLAMVWIFPDAGFAAWSVWAATAVTGILVFVKTDGISRTVMPGVMLFCGLAAVMNMHFYPTLSKWQPADDAAGYLHAENLAPENVVKFGTVNHAFDYYYRDFVPNVFDLNELADLAGNGLWVVVEPDKLGLLKEALTVEKQVDFESYPVTLLSTDFINPKTRSTVVKKLHLVFVRRD
jgi:4-amino-4-deoxy-L-arabinose transferase-like glycosyltransferase